MVLLVSSCQVASLGPELEKGREIWVSVDWSGFTQEVPTGMSLYFYPKDKSDSTPITYQSNSISGAMIYLPYGLYDVLLINQSEDEFGSMHFTGMDRFDTATAVLEERGTDWNARTDGQMVAYEPEWLAVDTFEDFDSERAESIKLKPHNVIYSAKASLGIEGLDRILSIRASITGMAGAYQLSKGLQTDDAVAHILSKWSLVPSEGNHSNGTVFTTFRTFGCPSGKYPLSTEDIVIHSSYRLGNEYAVDYSTSVGDLLIKNDSTRTIRIIADEVGDSVPVVIPVVSTKDSSGFEVSVDPWGEKKVTDVYVF